MNAPIRKIIHIDMDAFYASVEQRDNPELKGKPVAVGGGHRGVVAAASYEARRFGIRSAMPSVTAKRRCPDLVFVKPRFDAYKEVSSQIRAIFADYTELIEPLSLDEAYLDVTEDRKGLGSARAIAEDIRRRIREETGVTASAGVSYCKFIAKLASDQNKPDGLCVIPPEKGPAFVATLPVSQKSAQEWQLEHPDASQFTPVVAAAEAMAHLVCLHDDPERLLGAVETELLLAVLTTGDEEVLAV